MLFAGFSSVECGIAQQPAAPAWSGILAAFQRSDKRGQGTICRSDLVSVIGKLDKGFLDIERAIDASGTEVGGIVNYNDFLTWLFAKKE